MLGGGGAENTFDVFFCIDCLCGYSTLELFFTNKLSSPNLSNASFAVFSLFEGTDDDEAR